MKKPIYLKHIEVIDKNPEKLVGKTISDVFSIDSHSFFFKDQNQKIYYYFSFLSGQDVIAGIKLERNYNFENKKETYSRLYIYPSVFEGNIFEEFQSIQGYIDTIDTRYEWIKKAFEFGIFNKQVEKEYLKKLKNDYKEYAYANVVKAKENLKKAEEDLKKYDNN